MKKTVFTLIALVLALSLVLCGCGNEANTAPTGGGPMALTSWTLSPKTWSSPNGATVNLAAVVENYDPAVAAEFVVRQGDADVVNEPCTFEDGKLTAAAELNAADGYSYFVVLTHPDGTLEEISLSGADSPVSISLVNLASALNSYCNVLVEESACVDGVLKVSAGSVEIQVPQITDDGKAITCQEVRLVLTHDGEELNDVKLDVSASEVPGGYEGDLAGIAFSVPQLEDDGQLALRLEVTLSNGQVLTAEGGAWTFIDGQIISTVG